MRVASAKSGFPREPVAPAAFFERYLAARLALARVPREIGECELALGLELTGPEGGEWLLELGGGAATLRSGQRSSAELSLIQSVEDFRGALWEARGAALRARVVEQLPGALVDLEAPSSGRDAARLRRAIAQLAGLDALLRLRITAGAGEAWVLDLRLGPGALPALPAATVTLPLDVAEALIAGGLRPLDALLRIQVEGDYGLLLAAYGALKGAGV